MAQKKKRNPLATPARPHHYFTIFYTHTYFIYMHLFCVVFVELKTFRPAEAAGRVNAFLMLFSAGWLGLAWPGWALFWSHFCI